jgi:hypothetical protein
MRFMIMRRADADTEAGVVPSEPVLAAMAKYHEQLVKAGVMLQGDGLQPSSMGARVKFSSGHPQVIDGPFVEAKELIAGFSMLEVRSKEEAIEWVKRWPAIDGHGEVEIEIRQVLELADFAPSDAPEHHARVGEQIAAQTSRLAPPE